MIEGNAILIDTKEWLSQSIIRLSCTYWPFQDRGKKRVKFTFQCIVGLFRGTYLPRWRLLCPQKIPQRTALPTRQFFPQLANSPNLCGHLVVFLFQTTRAITILFSALRVKNKEVILKGMICDLNWESMGPSLLLQKSIVIEQFCGFF